jgi:hypothetical protein
MRTFFPYKVIENCRLGKGTMKFALEQTVKAQRRSRGMAVLFL